MSQSTGSNPKTEPKPPKRGFQLPSAYTILIVITVMVAVLTWIVPAGLYQSDENGRPKPGSFTRVEPSPQGIKAILGAPINGMYGVRSDPGKVNAHGELITLVDQGTVSVYNQGRLFGAIGVAFFIILLGAFITMAMETGAITTGVAALGHSLQARGPLLIAVLIVIFAIGGSTYGMAEESVGFIAIVTALVMILGYDTMTGLAIVLVGTGVGRIAGTVNPFSIGVASDAAGISPGDGIGLRLTLFVVLVTITIVYVLRYASRVKADPSRSVVADQRDEHYRHFVGERAAGTGAAVLDGRQKMILVVFALTFLLLIYSVIPWSDFGLGIPDLGWWFGELSALFMVSAVLIGVIAGFSEKKLISTFIAGTRDFLGAALIVAVARGVTVIMHNGRITDTILYSLEGVLRGASAGGFAVLMFLVNAGLAFLVPSSSGHAALAIPILAPLADFAHVPRAIAVTAFTAGNATLNMFTPTAAVLMAGLGIASVSYGAFFRFLAPLLAIIVVVVMAVLFIAASV